MPKLKETADKLGISKRAIFYSWLYTANLLIWLSLVLIVKERIESSNILFFLGFLPNFFASGAIFFKILEMNERPSKWSSFFPETDFKIALLVLTLLFLGELVQEFLLKGVFDILDLTSSILGLIICLFIHSKILSKVKLWKDENL